MDIVNSSVGSGIASASNQISNYFLKTAEQYQPVVSVPAGIGVEIVFQEGTYLGGERDEDEKITAKQ
jgi:conjugal transfer pilus assembly protein TraB